MFYLSAEQNLMAVPVKLGATVEAGAPQTLFPLAFASSGGAAAGAPINVILQWQAGVKK